MRIGWKQLFVDLKREWQRSDLTNVAGAVTFSAILALFPFLLFVVSLAALVIDPEEAEILVDSLRRVAPAAVTDILSERIQALARGGSPALLTASAIGSVWVASGGVVALMNALDTVYGVCDSRPFWKRRGLAVLLTLGGATLWIVASAVAIATPALASAIGGPLGTIILWLRIPLAALLLIVVVAALYDLLPDVEQEFRFFTPGSVLAVLAWIAVSLGFSAYVSNFGRYDATYGTLGGVIVLLVWMWISAIVVLFGGALNAVLERRSETGKRRGEKRIAARGAEAPAAREARAADGEPEQERARVRGTEPERERERPGRAAASVASIGGESTLAPPRARSSLPSARGAPPVLHRPSPRRASLAASTALWLSGFGFGVLLGRARR